VWLRLGWRDKFTLIPQSLVKVVKYLCQGLKMKYLHLLFIVASALIFSGCGPKYSVQKTYQAPLNSHECLEECAQKRTSCESSAILDYEDCVANVSLDASDAYYDALNSYALQAKRYERSLWQYERAIKTYAHSISHFTCKDSDKKCQKEYRALQTNKPTPPEAPKAPNFEDIIEHYIASCAPSNRCEVAYEACFGACGGQIQLHQHCISGCD
jgi:hypothetical protein